MPALKVKQVAPEVKRTCSIGAIAYGLSVTAASCGPSHRIAQIIINNAILLFARVVMLFSASVFARFFVAGSGE